MLNRSVDGQFTLLFSVITTIMILVAVVSLVVLIHNLFNKRKVVSTEDLPEQSHINEISSIDEEKLFNNEDNKGFAPGKQPDGTEIIDAAGITNDNKGKRPQLIIADDQPSTITSASSVSAVSNQKNKIT